MVNPASLPSHPIGFRPFLVPLSTERDFQKTLDLFEITTFVSPGCSRLPPPKKCKGNKPGCPKTTGDDWTTCDCGAAADIKSRVTYYVVRWQDFLLAASGFDAMLKDACRIFEDMDREPFSVLQVQKLLAAVLSKVRLMIRSAIICFRDELLSEIIIYSEKKPTKGMQPEPVKEGEPGFIFPAETFEPFPMSPDANILAAHWLIDNLFECILPILDDLETLNEQLDLWVSQAQRYGFPRALEHNAEELSGPGIRFEALTTPSECFVQVIAARELLRGADARGVADTLLHMTEQEDLLYFAVLSKCEERNNDVPCTPLCQNLCTVHQTSGVTQATWCEDNVDLNNHETHLRELRLSERTRTQVAVAVKQTNELVDAARKPKKEVRDYIIGSFPVDSPLRIHDSCLWITFGPFLDFKKRCDRCRTHWNPELAKPDPAPDAPYLSDALDTETTSNRPHGRCAEPMCHEACENHLRARLHPTQPGQPELQYLVNRTLKENINPLEGVTSATDTQSQGRVVKSLGGKLREKASKLGLATLMKRDKREVVLRTGGRKEGKAEKKARKAQSEADAAKDD